MLIAHKLRKVQRDFCLANLHIIDNLRLAPVSMSLIYLTPVTQAWKTALISFSTGEHKALDFVIQHKHSLLRVRLGGTQNYRFVQTSSGCKANCFKKRVLLTHCSDHYPTTINEQEKLVNYHVLIHN